MAPTPVPPETITQTKPKKFSRLKTFFIVIALILFGTLIGVLAARFIPMAGNMTVQNSPSTISPELSPTFPDEEAPTWETFVENSIGLTFKYPSSWAATKSSAEYLSILISPNSKNGQGPVPIQISIDSANEYNGFVNFLTIEQAQTHYLKSLNNGANITKNISVGGLVSSKIEGTQVGPGLSEGSIIQYTFVQMSGKVLIIQLGDSNYKETHDQILSTFSFSNNISSLSPTVSLVPSGWTKREFPTVKLVLYAPSDWKSGIQAFPEVPSNLIRFWQGVTSDTSTVQLNIKNSWDNMSGQYDARNFTINDTLSATKVDPPQKSEQVLDRYQTNYMFEKDGNVYSLNCVHNWIDTNYKMCETLLKTMEFVK